MEVKMYKLIITDDDELIRKGLEKVIPWEELGFTVIGVYCNALEALDSMKAYPADVILTDIRMPEMSGLELIEQAREYHSDLKAVIVSGYSEFEYARQAIELKVEKYLLKPLGQEEIEDTFQKIKEQLDAVQEPSVQGKPAPFNKEYELMRILNTRLQADNTFFKLLARERYCELIVIKTFKALNLTTNMDNLKECNKKISIILEQYFYCGIKWIFAALVLPSRLNGLMLQLKKEFSNYPDVVYRIAIGKEIYSETEVISSYWSAIELMKESEKSVIIHYEREGNGYKKDWDKVGEIRRNLVEALEHGRSEQVDKILNDLWTILDSYKCKDGYYFCSSIITKLIKYFKIERDTDFIFGNYSFEIAELDGDREQLKRDFMQDMDNLQQVLRENSESMYNIIVNKAIQIIDEKYADSDLTLASLANELNASYGYLSTIFTKAIGKSFKTYMVETRMEKARAMLITRKYKVYEIAEQVGYSNPRYFTDAFKKYFGCSPADYISNFHGHLEDNGDGKVV